MIERGISVRLQTDTKCLSQQRKTMNELKVIHAKLLKLPFSANTTSFTSLLSDAAASTNTALFSYACVVFQSVLPRTTFQYNTLIRGYMQSKQPIQAIFCYKDMLKDGLIKNKYTFTPLVKACSMVSQDIGLSVHAHVVKLGLGSDLFIGSALIQFYALNLDMRTAEVLFDETPMKDVVLWTSMIDGYGKIGDVKKARDIFDKMPGRNVVSWSAMIAAYSQKSDFREVLCLYKRMEELGLKPNESILVSALTACAHLGALAQGLWIHSYAKKFRYISNPILATALVDMYAKCGCVNLALAVFEEIEDKDSRAWNSIISGVALNGNATKSLELFNEMVRSGTRPTDATFVAVLTACTHARMVQEGLSLFESMHKVHNNKPKIEHYACVVDLLARSGGIEKAEKFIEDNIHEIGEGDANVWGALLGACRIHGKVEIGNRLWRKIAEKGVSDYGIHVLAYNMYREAGLECEAKSVRRQIEMKRMKKKPGCSAVEVNGIVEEFVAGDVLHPRGGNSEDVVTVIEAPRQSDLMVDLIKKLRPEVVVTGMGQFESVTSSGFEHLLETTREIGCRLFLDISDHFVLSSLPSSNGVLKYLARTRLPPHTTVVCGLLKNQVYQDLEVAFVISEDAEMFKALCRTVELLQGSTAIISQYYYGCLFHELLAFQLADRHPRAPRNGEKTDAIEVNGVTSLTYPVFSHAELSMNESDESSLVHMDIDQSFLPITTPVTAAIFESFARQNITESETDVTNGIRRLVSSCYGFPSDSNTEFVYAGSPLELFTNLVNCCAQESGTLCFPSGSNGNYVSSARFLKANVVTIPTNPEEGYKLTEETLSRTLETVSKPWIYISGPTINPTGLIYSNEEINKLISVCAKFGARIILDTSFSGVEYNSKGFDGWNLRATLEKISSANPAICVCLLGGLFFKMLASGLKFGFLLINQPSVVDVFHSIGGVSKPHSTIKYTVKKLLDLGEQETRDLSKGIAEQMEKLRSRFTSLKQTLVDSGWEVLDAEAGVSVLAKPSAYLGKTIQLSKGTGSQETKLNDTNIREAILSSTGLCINSAAWTGIPGYCRFTIALADEDFKRALDCIVHFKSLLL